MVLSADLPAATKAKQRSEISKLRRALRDSFSGMPLPSTTFASLPLNSPLTPFSPSLDVDESEYFDDEIVDSELEVKWERISDLVGVMRRRGEEAVVKGREEIKLGQRVLGWSEVQLEAGREGENEKDCRRKGEEDFGRGADFTEREDFEGKDDSAREEDLSEVREEDTDDCVEPS